MELTLLSLSIKVFKFQFSLCIYWLSPWRVFCEPFGPSGKALGFGW